MEQSTTISKVPILIRTANERIQAGLLLPDISSLLGNVWQTGELAILFGGTGTGKSILAVQIADAISKGESVSREYLKNECQPQVVLFFDFELTDKQFQIRYTRDEGKFTYTFSDNLKYVCISFGEIYDPKANITDVVFTIITESIKETRAKILIVDNITALSSQDTQDGNAATLVMSYLDKLKRNHSMSILVIAHTPKKFNFTPITIGDLAGSSKLSNFSDCVFAIGKSIKSPDHRYLIQTKFSRSKKEAFDFSNVLSLIKLKDDNYLKYLIDGTTTEKEHLFADGDDLKLQAISLRSQGMPLRDIGEKLKVGKTTIANWTKDHYSPDTDTQKAITHMDNVDKVDKVDNVDKMDNVDKVDNMDTNYINGQHYGKF